MTVADSLQSLHHARYGTWIVARDRDVAFHATLVGAALARFESALGRAAAYDATEGADDKKMRRLWGASDKARAELTTFIEQLLEGRYRGP